MREKLYELVRMGKRNNVAGRLYDILITVSVIASVVPLMFKESRSWMVTVDVFTAYVLLFDYVLRWATIDYKEGKVGRPLPFFLYPFMLSSIITMLSILPSLNILPQGWKVLRILRVAVLFVYSKELILVTRVFRRQRKALYAVLSVVAMYVFSCALIMFNAEPDTFPDFFQALYWATTALTTIGYGDYYPLTPTGQFISMISSVVGIAIVALPTGILTTGFMEELQYQKEEEQAALENSHREIFNKDSFKNFLMIIGLSMLNIALFYAMEGLGLPLWLDTTGTVFAAALLDPVAGVIVAFLNNSLLATLLGTRAIVYFTVGAAVSLITGNLVRDRKTQKIIYGRFAHAGLLSAMAAGFLSACCRYLVGNAVPNLWEENIRLSAVSKGVNGFLAEALSSFIVKIGEMAIIFLALFIICEFLKRVGGVEVQYLPQRKWLKALKERRKIERLKRKEMPDADEDQRDH